MFNCQIARAAYAEYLEEMLTDEDPREFAETLQREWEDRTMEVLQTMDRDDPTYSDLYKDLYGVRPRW